MFRQRLSKLFLLTTANTVIFKAEMKTDNNSTVGIKKERTVTSFILGKLFAAGSSCPVSYSINNHWGSKRLTWVLWKQRGEKETFPGVPMYNSHIHEISLFSLFVFLISTSSRMDTAYSSERLTTPADEILIFPLTHASHHMHFILPNEEFLHFKRWCKICQNSNVNSKVFLHDYYSTNTICWC